jgi:hypothetical protein
MSDTSTTAIAAATTGTGVTVRHISLDTPIVRGDQTIGLIEIRKPASGELRGLTMLALSQLDYTALETLLPRITNPPLTKQEIAALDPADFMQLGGEVMDFLLPKAAKPASLN